MADYYDRTPTLHLDGTHVFQTEEDRRNEEEVAAACAAVWHCRIGRFGALSPVDWYGERDGRLVGVLELKARGHALDHYPTVFLNVRKWLALTLAAVGLGCPAIFVVKFTDGVYWAPLSKIDATQHRIAGCAHIVKNGNDIEPVIEVPVSTLSPLSTTP
jgi:hypothetical protein